jgi:hypothetical protein
MLSGTVLSSSALDFIFVEARFAHPLVVGLWKWTNQLKDRSGQDDGQPRALGA